MLSRKKLENIAEQAEQRALNHFEKLNQITELIIRAELNKEPAIITRDKIKEVITCVQTR